MYVDTNNATSMLRGINRVFIAKGVHTVLSNSVRADDTKISVNYNKCANC